MLDYVLDNKSCEEARRGRPIQESNREALSGMYGCITATDARSISRMPFFERNPPCERKPPSERNLPVKEIPP